MGWNYYKKCLFERVFRLSDHFEITHKTIEMHHGTSWWTAKQSPVQLYFSLIINVISVPKTAPQSKWYLESPVLTHELKMAK